MNGKGAETLAIRAVRSQGRLIAWIADQTGIERSRLSRVLHEELPIRPEEAQRLAPILGLPADLIGRARWPGNHHQGYTGPRKPQKARAQA